MKINCTARSLVSTIHISSSVYAN